MNWRPLHDLGALQRVYFTVRGLPWRGEKEAIRYLTAADPTFLANYRRCLAERDRARKAEQYAALADLALAPVGGPLPEGTVVVSPGPGFGVLDETGTNSAVESALAFWQGLIAEDER